MKTDLISLRRWEDSDAETLYKYASDPEVGPLAGWPPHQSVEESLSVIRTFYSEDSIWAIVLNETGGAIGCVGYLTAKDSNLNIDDSSAEVGYWVAKPYWNRGICSEALNLVVDYCFNVKGFASLWGAHFTANPASGKVMEKCGFAPTGVETTCQNLMVGAENPARVLKLEKTSKC